jgi:hypothetical protein
LQELIEQYITRLPSKEGEETQRRQQPSKSGKVTHYKTRKSGERNEAIGE